MVLIAISEKYCKLYCIAFKFMKIFKIVIGERTYGRLERLYIMYTQAYC